MHKHQRSEKATNNCIFALSADQTRIVLTDSHQVHNQVRPLERLEVGVIDGLHSSSRVVVEDGAGDAERVESYDEHAAE